MPKPERHDFADRGSLAENLADRVAAALDEATAERGRATLAVSGGNTPRRFFEALSVRDIAWDRVTITLVDERYVPETSDRSNQRLVVETLLKDKAARARFLPLYYDAADPVLAADRASAVIDALPRPIDVAILGMGTDGHTASFFPGGDRLAEALSDDGTKAVIAMEAAGAGEPRLTLTLPRIAEARLIVLHIEGEEKRRALDTALGDGAEEAMPIRAILRRAAAAVQIYWAR